MKDFFGRNRIILGIIAGTTIAGTVIYFSVKNFKKSANSTAQIEVKNCENIPHLPDGARKFVTKVIDGDTFLIEGGYSVRILGIDADEEGYDCYQEAKKELEEMILNKEVRLEMGAENLDRYCRYLRYVFLDDKNVGLELVKKGLAVARFSGDDVKYREEIVEAERRAKENKIGCKWVEKKLEEEKKTELKWEKLTPQLTGLKVINACEAENYYEKEVIVEGKVVATTRSKTNTVFLNFEKPYPQQCFSAVIFSADQYKFVSSPEDYYLNKTVRIRGEIKEYRGKPEIILKDPSQIEVGK